MTNSVDRPDGQTVLIVEDQALMRRTLGDFLQDAFPDCRILTAADGACALQVCNASRPLLVLMDTCLPDADGIELTGRLRQMYPAIQVIVMSYKSGEIYVRHALAAGARAYLLKDNLASELIPAVAAAMGAEPGSDRGFV